MLPIAEGIRLINAMPEADCLIVDDKGTLHRSEGWQKWERAAPTLADPGSPKGAIDDPRTSRKNPAHWSDDFDLVVRFEINRPEVEQRRYRRPFVVVYIEDESGHVVRHLLMWLSMSGSGGEQWLPDLLRWYRSDVGRTRIEKRNKAYAIGRSTRPPGAVRHLLERQG